MSVTIPPEFTAITEDKQLHKRILREGKGEIPPTGAEVKVHYVGTLFPSGEQFDTSRGRKEPFTFSLGDGSVIKGWEEGVATMRVGELAEFIIAPEYAYGERGSPPKIPANATLKFEIELLDFAQSFDNNPDRIKAAKKYKDQGNAAFKEGDWEGARNAYQKAIDQLDDIWEETDEEKPVILETRVAVLSNMAAVHLKREEYKAAVKSAKEATSRDPKHAKSYYRLAQAQLALGEFDAATEAAQKGLELVPNDPAFKAVLVNIRKQRSDYERKEKAMYANMFQH
jgi:tetratricopeptide (TPR) repeat protein